MVQCLGSGELRPRNFPCGIKEWPCAVPWQDRLLSPVDDQAAIELLAAHGLGTRFLVEHDGTLQRVDIFI